METKDKPRPSVVFGWVVTALLGFVWLLRAIGTVKDQVGITTWLLNVVIALFHDPFALAVLPLAVLVVLVMRNDIENLWYRARKLAGYRGKTNGQISEDLSMFITEGQALRKRSSDDPLPIAEHNDWATRIKAYLSDNLDNAYVVRLSDFTGMVFYGDGSDKAKFEQSLDGRIRRMHEFIKEFS